MVSEAQDAFPSTSWNREQARTQRGKDTDAFFREPTQTLAHLGDHEADLARYECEKVQSLW